MSQVLTTTDLPNLVHRGKVRDMYNLGEDLFLIIVTDRVSAFDVVMPTGIPDKGIVLNQLSGFWFKYTSGIVPNHLVEVVDDAGWLNSTYGDRVCVSYYSYPSYVARRSMIVRKAERIDIECIVRGYLSGSAWSEYRKEGTVGGLRLPAGLKDSDKFPEPLFTPTTKEETGHDEPITIREMENLIGRDVTREIMDKSLAIYDAAARYALERGIIIADTKMEFGRVDGKIIIIDELLTPDSSRFWDAAIYEPGKSQPSFDKQHLRDWLVDTGWNKEPPAPELPAELVEELAKRYRDAYSRLTGKEL